MFDALRRSWRSIRNFFSAMWLYLAFYVVGFALLTVFLVTAGLMADSGAALRAAEGLGLHDARIVAEHRLFAGLNGCSSSDAAAFDVRALNADDEPVALTVCVGWPFKGATPRFQ